MTFVLADPALWIDPLGRLSESVFFHWRFATGAYVKKAGLPWFQPFVWLTHAAPARWHPGVFPVSWLDPILLVVATLGIPAAWRKRPLWVAWAVVGLVFLLLWPTKWPQYTMVIRPPLAVLAGMGLASAATWIAGRVGLSRRAET